MLMTKGNLARAYVRCQRLDDAMALLEETFLNIKGRYPNWAEITTGKAEVQLRLGKLGDAEATCCDVFQRLTMTNQPRGHWVLRLWDLRTQCEQLTCRGQEFWSAWTRLKRLVLPGSEVTTRKVASHMIPVILRLSFAAQTAFPYKSRSP